MKPWTRYRQNCPKCLSKICEVLSEDFCEDWATQRFSCDSCGCSWENHYEFSTGEISDEGEL